ncbi:hypothetical protein TRFO_20527 [Tritrichomonas foetus]|uniref:Uncharacterized protein n=1 Tax=Tritrichomonas foetus TaxID=1144522 RepID=A0A1J4KLH5_9EUKA|nr:hypothetical protein TRFO_20527 [Tritrichomonas foetus]|eukprot:OHT10229.1 hypothetical protein TRFO_20527 [Tritrichomonas foetus]
MNSSQSPVKLSETILTILSIWDEIGYSDDEKDEGLRKINAQIENVRADFISKTLQQCQTVMAETEQIRQKHIAMLKVIDAPESEIDKIYEYGKTGTIKEKYEEVKSKYKEFLVIYKTKRHEFEVFQKQIDSCFHSIGIINDEQKGEFTEIGEKDLTLARLRRYEKKANELNEEVDSRSIRFDDIKKKILSMNHDLQEELPNDIQELLNKRVFSNAVFNRLEEFILYLKDLTKTRQNYISEMGVEITRLWDLLHVEEGIRRQFHASHTALSQKNVQDCIDEADRLTQIRNQHLPEIIERIKDDIIVICQSLGYSKEQKDEIIKKCENPPNSIPQQENLNSESENPEQAQENNEELNENDQNENPELNTENNEKDKDENDEKGEIEDNADKTEDNVIFVNENGGEDDIIEGVPTPNFDENPLINIFNRYDSELIRLKKIQLVAQPIIDLINQRSEIISEYEEVINRPVEVATEDNISETSEQIKIRRFDQLNGKNLPIKKRIRPTDAKEKLHIEKVTRRHKCVLPRVEKKLFIHLVQFREQTDEDFLWEGKPIINELSHIHVSKSELNQNKVLNKSLRKTSKQTKGSKNTTEANNNPVGNETKKRKSMSVKNPNKTKGGNKKAIRKSEVPQKMNYIINEE